MKKILVLVLVFTCSLLAFSWYKPGFIIGGGEAGLSFLYPERTASFYKSGWIEIGTGIPQSVAHSSYPIFK